jgi:hypothetical protein
MHIFGAETAYVSESLASSFLTTKPLDHYISHVRNCLRAAHLLSEICG